MPRSATKFSPESGNAIPMDLTLPPGGGNRTTASARFAACLVSRSRVRAPIQEAKSGADKSSAGGFCSCSPRGQGTGLQGISARPAFFVQMGYPDQASSLQGSLGGS